MVFADPAARPLAELVSLDGRVVVVTGAARGLGFAAAARAHEAGAHVVLLDRDGAALPAARDRLGDRATAIVVDVTEPGAVDAALLQVHDHRGRLDGLVNNVGVFPWATVLDMTDDQWHEVLDTDLTSALRCARAFARLADPARGGVIVNVTSTEAHRGRVRLAHYTAAKFGLHGLTRSLALELGPRNIRVLDVAPGLAATESTAGIARLHDPDEQARLPAGRFATADDVARVVLFALSDLAAFVTGTALVVDGGELAG